MSLFLVVALLARIAHADPDPLLRPEDRVAVLQALAAADMTVADRSWQGGDGALVARNPGKKR